MAAKDLPWEGAAEDVEDTEHHCPDHVAAEKDHGESVKVLLEARADLEARSRGGWTPLMYAAVDGSNEALQLLIKAGAISPTANIKSLDNVPSPGPISTSENNSNPISDFSRS